MNQSEKIQSYRGACRVYLQKPGRHLTHLFFEQLPIHMVSTEYDAVIKIKRIDWNNDGYFSSGVHQDGHRWAGTPFESYTESCKAYLTVKLRTSIHFSLDFEADIEFETTSQQRGNDLVFETIAHTPYTRVITRFHNLVLATQSRFQLKTIATTTFNGEISFSFYCDIMRKSRSAQPTNPKLRDMSFVEQLESAHGEIAVHISHALTYVPLVDDLLARKIINEGDILYMPNVHYYSHQYYISCTSAFERLYTFWETLIVIPYNYDSLGFQKGKTPSFGSYFRKLIDHYKNQKPVLFSKHSPNLKWLLNFFTRDYDQITQYRHRFVHHDFTPDNDGLLSAKYTINAWQNIGNKTALEKLNEEIRIMPSILIKQFNLCIEGFKRMLYLVDELP